MHRIINYLKGYTIVRIKGASPEWALNRLVQERVAFWNAEQVEPLVLMVCVFQRQEDRCADVCKEAMCDCDFVKRIGLCCLLEGMMHRPVLLSMMVLCIAISIWLPYRILFYEVIGNAAVPKDQILRAIYENGTGFGQCGPNFDPRRIRNLVLEKIPDLQWLTITQHGCRAKVVVKERDTPPKISSTKGYSNMIASQSGQITKQSVLSGQAKYKDGDMVSKGDLLISGIVDLDRVYHMVKAQGEVYARTWRSINICIPYIYEGKKPLKVRRHCLWLLIGNKRIKLYGNSGISYTGCDKMNSRWELNLPNELHVPFGLELETFWFYENTKHTMDAKQAHQILKDYMERDLLNCMQKGQIMHTELELKKENGCYILSGYAECHEMIAVPAENKENNGEVEHD